MLDLATGWDPERCACRWGEQPCDRCLPVLDARFRERQLRDKLGATVQEVTRIRHTDRT